MRAVIVILLFVAALMVSVGLACNDPDYQGGGRSMDFPANMDSGSGEPTDDSGEQDSGVDMGNPMPFDAGSDVVDTGIVVLTDAGSSE